MGHDIRPKYSTFRLELTVRAGSKYAVHAALPYTGEERPPYRPLGIDRQYIYSSCIEMKEGKYHTERSNSSVTKDE